MGKSSTSVLHASVLAFLLATPWMANAQTFRNLCSPGPLELAVAGTQTIWAATSQETAGAFTFLFVPQFNDCAAVPMLANNTRPLFMATGGGSLAQPDGTWAFFESQGPFQFSGGQWNQPAAFSLGGDPFAHRYAIGVSYGDDCHPYEGWVERVDNSNNKYLGRYTSCFFGGFFPSVPSSTDLSRVATGGGEVWALDSSDRVYRFDTGTQAFVPIPGNLSQIAVGVDGVWGINANGAAFEFNPITQSWDALASPQLSAIWAGGDGVFARQCLGPVLEGALARAPTASITVRPPLPCGAGQLMRYEPVTRRFVPITTSVQPAELSVGSGAGAVGVDSTLSHVLLWTE